MTINFPIVSKLCVLICVRRYLYNTHRSVLAFILAIVDTVNLQTNIISLWCTAKLVLKSVNSAAVPATSDITENWGLSFCGESMLP